MKQQKSQRKSDAGSAAFGMADCLYCQNPGKYLPTQYEPQWMYHQKYHQPLRPETSQTPSKHIHKFTVPVLVEYLFGEQMSPHPVTFRFEHPDATPSGYQIKRLRCESCPKEITR